MPEENSHWIVITNPKSGKRAFHKQKQFIVEQLTAHSISYSFFETLHSGHAIKLAKEYVEQGYVNFLVWGGDGSISEVINGIFTAENVKTEEITFGIIPRGTGNDWARFWKIKKDDKKSLDIFLRGNKKLLDVGKIKMQNNKAHYFINSVGFGLDGKVCQLMHQLKKYVGSFSFLYTIGLLMAVFKYKSIPAEVTVSENLKKALLFTMNIANGPYSGGGIKQNPEALPYDGIFDMILVEKPSFKDILTALPLIFNGKLTKHPVIMPFKTDKVRLKCNGILAEADGITIDNVSECEVTIIKNAINMIVP